MPRFNQPLENPNRRVVTNLAGGEAYGASWELQIASILLTSFVNDQFYRKGSEAMDELTRLIQNARDPQFAAKAALMARDEFNMRSITHVAMAELAHAFKGESWMRQFIANTIVRVDDMTETIAYYQGKYGKDVPIPNSLKAGIRQAFNKFDGFQLAKYKAEGKSVSLVDVVNLVHPVPTAKNAEALGLLVKGKLKQSGTWENEVSDAGGGSEAKSEAWGKLIAEDKLGYMAMLRNLRNILEAVDSPEAIGTVVGRLTDPERVKRSRQLPYRFVSAHEALMEVPRSGNRDLLLGAVESALDTSLANVPHFGGDTLIAMDCSGSMRGRFNLFGGSQGAKGMANKPPIEVAGLFAAILYKTNPADLMLFDSYARYIQPNPRDSVFTIRDNIMRQCTGGATHFHTIYQEAHKKYDRIIVLSDMQGWVGGGRPDTAVQAYKRQFNANPFIYSWDLTGYGSLMFPEDKVFTLAGFSDKVFDIMGALEEGADGMLKKINAVSLTG